MLGKLFKYDMTALSRILLPLHAVAILLTLIGKVAIYVNNTVLRLPEVVVGLSIAFYVLYMVAICVVTMVITLYYLYKSMFSDQGYLTFTLPVKSESLIVSKTLASLIWYIIDAIVITGCALFLVMDAGTFSELIRIIGELFRELPEIVRITQGKAVTTILLTGLGIPLGMISAYLSMVLCFCLGQLSNQHKVLWSLLAMVGIGFLQNIVSIVITLFFGRRADTLFDEYYVYDSGIISGLSFVNTILICSLVYCVIIGVVSWIVSNYIMKKRLNLA